MAAGKARYMPTGHIVLDIEIARTVEQAGGWDSTGAMGVACAAVYEVGRDRYRLFDSSELEDLQECIKGSDRITTWNGWRFDLPVIYGVDRPDWPASPFASQPGGKDGKPLSERSRDLLRDVWAAQGLDPDAYTPAHGGWKLEDVGETITGVGKDGDGADAPKLYKDGQWGSLMTYCMHDVWLTNQVERFIRRHGFVVNARGKIVRFGKKAA
jgi:hypothetical protein